MSSDWYVFKYMDIINIFSFFLFVVMEYVFLSFFLLLFLFLSFVVDGINT